MDEDGTAWVLYNILERTPEQVTTSVAAAKGWERMMDNDPSFNATYNVVPASIEYLAGVDDPPDVEESYRLYFQ